MGELVAGGRAADRLLRLQPAPEVLDRQVLVQEPVALGDALQPAQRLVHVAAGLEQEVVEQTPQLGQELRRPAQLPE